MKKGSRMRKCGVCGKPICWIVPVRVVFGLQEVDFQNICDWKYYKVNKKYFKCVCMDCYNKLMEDEQHAI